MARGESAEQDQADVQLPPGSAENGEGSNELWRVPAEIRDVSFAVSLRGYDREAVDAYVATVNRLIAELDVSGSPEAAVRHALEQVGEQTSGLLQHAGETAEEITLGARREAEEATAHAKAEAEEIVAQAKSEADEILGRSKAEAETIAAQASEEATERLQRSQDQAAAIQEEAEARLRELDADTETIRQQRRVLLDDLRGIAAQVAETASSADARFPPGGPAALPEEETADIEPDTESRENSVDTVAEPRDGQAARQPQTSR